MNFPVSVNIVFLLGAMVVVVVNSTTYTIQDTFNPLAIGVDATRLIYQQLNIPVIPSAGLFSHLSILERLEFFDTEVVSLEPGAFQGLSALTFLDFSSKCDFYSGKRCFSGSGHPSTTGVGWQLPE